MKNSTETSAAHYAVSPELFRKIEDLYTWFGNPETIHEELWRIYHIAFSDDDIDQRTSASEAGQIVYTVLLFNSVLSSLVVEYKEWKEEQK